MLLFYLQRTAVRNHRETIHPYGLYTTSGIYYCADCDYVLVLHSNRRLPTCVNYTNETHKKSFWIQMDTDDSSREAVFASYKQQKKQ